MNRLDAAGVLALGVGTVAGSLATTVGRSTVVAPAVGAVCVGVAVVLVARVTSTRIRPPEDPNR